MTRRTTYYALILILIIYYHNGHSLYIRVNSNYNSENFFNYSSQVISNGNDSLTRIHMRGMASNLSEFTLYIYTYIYIYCGVSLFITTLISYRILNGISIAIKDTGYLFLEIQFNDINMYCEVIYCTQMPICEAL